MLNTRHARCFAQFVGEEARTRAEVTYALDA